MAPISNLGGWIHSFTVTNTQTHKGGYTIYKITSVIFPRSVPQALTCLTIWKRFHDVKRLHRELSRRHKNLKLAGQLPEPTDCSYFKRFDPNVIQRRKEYILQLLDFAAQHPGLYKCHAFAQFFSDGEHVTSPTFLSPLQQSQTVIKEDAIAGNCANRDLRYDLQTEGLTLLDPDCNKLINIEDGCAICDTSAETLIRSNITTDKICESVNAEQPCKDYTRFLTPMASIESDDCDYIYEAALEFSRAVQAEVNLEYNEAYKRYKCGVEILLDGSKDDSNDERKSIARAKISKYLARSDDLYSKFLCDDFADNPRKSNFQLSVDVTDGSSNESVMQQLERPSNQLAKYKVLQALADSVMQVQCVTESQHSTYVIKGIEKPSSSSPTQTIFLPQHVPYMIDLLSYFQTKHKIFLLLRHAEGGRLYDYIQTYTPIADKLESISGLFPEVKETATGNLKSTSTQHSCMPNSVSGSLSPGPTELTDLVHRSRHLLEEASNISNKDETNGQEFVNKEIVAIRTSTNVKTHSQIPEASLKQWARELAIAINSLHEKGVVLGDLHMDNLLLGAKGQLLLSYFYQYEGIANDSHVRKALNLHALTGHYVAPERPLHFRSDWWSYGIILYQLLLGMSFKAAHPGRIELYGCVQYAENIELSEDAKDLLNHLLQQSPGDRLNFKGLKQHAFFKGTNWDDVHQNGLNCETYCHN